ncbi:conserved hypothetical protein [Xenorhabdus nematophila F1]|uniref:Uncharacterized protein n=1 Tax=Xenorhabdus nematophila (strain ATCC 19061 / DSM 3370 / CCUG 14189 / LMG 1036 / NCIMB 9965 / AN6) TaxID=406817 RepID=D3VGT1_XENNA|nr:hypothetical protein XNC1_2458 [Xenorhabdus nematophila ATCC 19061]CCW32538.1 conserved hypothetical protein [Xenorhabdus nematophila F1]CEK23358.1 hypothetical protein XNC2_2364 [Xenorhabdus nematophila AN6/1]
MAINWLINSASYKNTIYSLELYKYDEFF